MQRWAALAWLTWAMLLAGASVAAAQSAPQLLSFDGRIDKAPSISGDIVAWTSDASRANSTGSIHVMDLSSGDVTVIGPGFLPDVDNYTSTGPVDPVTRVVYLRLALVGDGLDVMSARLGPGGWVLTMLAGNLPYADSVRVCGDMTAWTAPGHGGELTVWVNDGSTTTPVSQIGNAFRPELAFNTNGVLFVVWDAYIGGLGEFEYEIFFSRRIPTAACGSRGSRTEARSSTAPS